MKESWQPVQGYEGLYEVSDQGRVWSVDRVVERKSKWGTMSKLRVKGRILQPLNMNSGYPAANLSKGGKPKIYYVHSLVACAFIGPRPAGLQINHKDCDKYNNAVENLEYITHAENVEHAVRAGRFAARLTSSKACPQPPAVA